MLPYKEYLINGCCPYCKRELSIIFNHLNDRMIYRCSDCAKSLTVITTHELKAIIEPGTNYSMAVDAHRIDKGCCGQ